jgi:hypothetical protein
MAARWSGPEKTWINPATNPVAMVIIIKGQETPEMCHCKQNLPGGAGANLVESFGKSYAA